MSGWTNDELARIGGADELQLTALGRTVTIWVVRVGDELYVRSYRGPNGSWFRRARKTHHGHISAGGVDADVEFVDADDTDDAVDAAYRSKYQRYGGRYVDPMVAVDARATTLKLVPEAASNA